MNFIRRMTAFLSITCGFICFLSCGKDPVKSENPISAADYFPIIQGAKYTYRVRPISSDSSNGKSAVNVIVTVNGTKKMGDPGSQKKDFDCFKNGDISYIFHIDTSEACYRIEGSIVYQGFEAYEIPIFNFSENAQQYHTVQCHESKMEGKKPITVPAGTFNDCILIVVRYCADHDIDREYYFARGIGLIKVIDAFYESELVSYQF
jgi:hypothetical protein